ncbi:hypothetical protein EI94DRAFT_1704128 [Lactarius quietus]|nr:hypothetical protein EI94DRAFT_1704128 [Lactarius quietus]
MPKPKGSHWIFTKEIQTITEWKMIPFYICNTHKSDDKSLQAYEKSAGRTVSWHHCTVTPKEGEVIISIARHCRTKQISIHPRFLIPWEPMVSGEVIAIQGSWFGIPGIVKEEKGEGQWLVFKGIEYIKGFFLQDRSVSLSTQKGSESTQATSSTYKYQFLTKDVMEKYGVYSAAALSFRGLEECGEIRIGTGHSSDLNCVKGLTAKMASQTNTPLLFHNNATGCMLIPIKYLTSYNKDPVSVQAKLNAGSDEFHVTGTSPPSFLYEDPDNYNPKKVLSSFMRGYFFMHAIFSDLRMAMEIPKTGDKPTCQSMCEMNNVRQVTIPIMVYVAIVVGIQHFILGVTTYTSIGLTLFEFTEHMEWQGWVV